MSFPQTMSLQQERPCVRAGSEQPSKLQLLLPSCLCESATGAAACLHWHLGLSLLGRQQSGPLPADRRCGPVICVHQLAYHRPASGIKYAEAACNTLCAHFQSVLQQNSMQVYNELNKSQKRLCPVVKHETCLSNLRAGLLSCGLVGVTNKAKSFTLSSPLAAI